MAVTPATHGDDIDRSSWPFELLCRTVYTVMSNKDCRNDGVISELSRCLNVIQSINWLRIDQVNYTIVKPQFGQTDFSL